MAVRLSEEAVRDAVDPGVFAEAEKLLASTSFGDVVAAGGGAGSVVHDGRGPRLDVWVGIVGGALTAECDCAAMTADPAELCAHAVAVTLGALRGGIVWASAAAPPSSVVVDPEMSRLAELAGTLPPRRLAMLVAEMAVADRRLRTRLMAYAGVAGPLSDGELTALRRTIDSVAGAATAGQWDMYHVVQAGEAIAEELEILVQRPPSPEALRLVEHAAVVWDGLAAHLFDAWETYEGVPEELGEKVRAVHVRMCEELQPDPDELAGRLTEIIGQAEVTSCLDAPDDYLPLLGRDRVATLRHG